jgi:GR25 family glycosyltransferase involved in LPS biosynthesis
MSAGTSSLKRPATTPLATATATAKPLPNYQSMTFPEQASTEKLYPLHVGKSRLNKNRCVWMTDRALLHIRDRLLRGNSEPYLGDLTEYGFVVQGFDPKEQLCEPFSKMAYDTCAFLIPARIPHGEEGLQMIHIIARITLYTLNQYLLRGFKRPTNFCLGTLQTQLQVNNHSQLIQGGFQLWQKPHFPIVRPYCNSNVALCRSSVKGITAYIEEERIAFSRLVVKAREGNFLPTDCVSLVLSYLERFPLPPFPVVAQADSATATAAAPLPSKKLKI